jgi:hypothetical protein
VGCELHITYSADHVPVSETTASDVPSPDKVFCKFEYQIGDKADISLCSELAIFDNHVATLTDQYEVSKALYPKFIKPLVDEFPASTDLTPTVYLTTAEKLNDQDLFPRKVGNGKVVGWYIGENQGIYITDAVFLKVGETDFPHELAHWYNHVLGLHTLGSAENEKLATAFEAYYSKYKF